VREVLREEGFAPSPRRPDEERPDYPRPTVEPVGRRAEIFSRSQDAYHPLWRTLPLRSRSGESRFRPDGIPGPPPRFQDDSRRRSFAGSLALKLWSVERKSYIMALVADEGLALFAGFNAIPKKSYLSEYSSRIGTSQSPNCSPVGTSSCMARPASGFFPGEAFNVDFHSSPTTARTPSWSGITCRRAGGLSPCLTASNALRSARWAYCSGCRSASNIGSSTRTAAVCATLSRIAGTFNGLCFPSGLGIYTRRTGCGRYVLLFSSCVSSSNHFFNPYFRCPPNVWPSTPAAPRFTLQHS